MRNLYQVKQTWSFLNFGINKIGNRDIVMLDYSVSIIWVLTQYHVNYLITRGDIWEDRRNFLMIRRLGPDKFAFLSRLIISDTPLCLLHNWFVLISVKFRFHVQSVRLVPCRHLRGIILVSLWNRKFLHKSTVLRVLVWELSSQPTGKRGNIGKTRR